jgi:hypothetical protein
VKVTAMDLAVLMAVAMTEYLPKAFQAAFSGEELDIESEMEQFFANALDDPEAKMVTNNITIPLVKVEDQWKIDLSEDSSLEFANAVTGGLVDFLTGNWVGVPVLLVPSLFYSETASILSVSVGAGEWTQLRRICVGMPYCTST